MSRDTGTLHRPHDPPSAEPWIGFEASGIVMGFWKNISFALWAKQGTVELIGELARVSYEYRERNPGAKVSSVHLILNQAGMPDGDTRSALTNLSEEYIDTLTYVGTMIEGTGFWASAMRGLVTSLLLVSPRRAYKTHICATTHELANWLADPHVRATGVPIDAGEFEAVLNGLLARESIVSARKG